ncbi:MAG: type IX secretion system membrane protein PorP/SprF [Bacteroidota bacterium]
MRKTLPIILSLLAGSFFSAHAQIDPLYAQYLNNPLLINPAYTGFNNNLNASVTYRKQWAGFDGSPSTVNASGHTSLFDNKMGLGLIILQDQAGTNKNTEVAATYAYKLDLDEKYISFGLQAGMVSFRNDNSDLNIYDPNDVTFTGDQTYTKPSFGAGVIFSSQRYFLGLSVPRLLKATATLNNATTSTENELYSQHFYMVGSYMIFLNERIRLKPSVLLKGVKGAPLSADLNFALNLDEKYTAGVFTRNFNTYGLLAQLKVGENYRFGYTFEVPSNQSVGARFTTHEFSFGLNLALFSFHDTSSITNF